MSRAARRRAQRGLGPGQTVAGRYRLEAKLGEGGMAEVFRAQDLATSRRVAVKVLHPEIAANPEAVERAKREGQVLSELDNPAIVSVETFGQLEDETVFVVMELLEGETLGERMRRGPMDPAELAPIVAGTCAGLHAAHTRGIVHRDLKPDNIFLCPTDHGLQVKLLDFGISKVYGSKKLTQTGEILGTPRYMSPEQLGAEPDVDDRVDVYALGVILYEALAGRPPFLASIPTDLIIAILNGKVAPLSTARTDVPKAVEAVVMRAMSKVRAARFDSAMELAEAYIDAVGGPGAVRGHQRRGMATRAFGGMLAGGSDATRPPGEVVPDTRPPPSPASTEPGGGRPASREEARELRIGTFSGFEAPPEEVATARSGRPERRTEVRGAAGGVGIPDEAPEPIPTKPQPEEGWDPADASAEDRPTSPAKPGASRRALPPTRETPAALVDDVLAASRAGEPEPASAPAGPASSSGALGRRGATEVMDPEAMAALSSAPAATAGSAPAGWSASWGSAGADSAHSVAAAVPSGAGRGGRGRARPGRWLLVVAALVAGAASAAAVIGALQLYEHRQRQGGEPTESGPAEPEGRGTGEPVQASVEPQPPEGDGSGDGPGAIDPAAEDPAAEDPAAEDPAAEDPGQAGAEPGSRGAGADPAAAAQGAAPEATAPGATAPGASGRRRGSSRRGRQAARSSSRQGRSSSRADRSSSRAERGAGSSGDDGEAERERSLPGFGVGPVDRPSGEGDEPDRPPTPMEALRTARAALRGGEPQRCVQILNEAIRSGAPAIALRRRAECHEAAGDRQAAVRDFRRFCMLVPDHPALAEVRPLMGRWGQSCP